MEIPSFYKTDKYPFYELIGAGVVLVIALTTLISRYLYFNIIFDTAYLSGAMALVYAEWNKNTPEKLPALLRPKRNLLFICLYLFIDAVLVSGMLFPNAGFLFLFYVSLAVLYGMSLQLRLKESNIRLLAWPWKNLLRYPATMLTIGIAVCMFCMYLPMVHYYMPFHVYTGPQYGYNAITGFGMNHPGVMLHGGSHYYFKGYQAFLGHLVCLLLAFMLVFHTIRVTGFRDYPRTETFMKAGVIAVGVWWLLGARGYRSLGQMGNLLFIGGFALLVFALFFSKQADTLFKKNGVEPRRRGDAE